MNDDQLTDLKQFIDSKISQSEQRIRSDMATKDDIKHMATKDDIRQIEQNLEQKIDDVDLKLDTIADTLHGQLGDHELRITKLEQKTA